MISFLPSDHFTLKGKQTPVPLDNLCRYFLRLFKKKEGMLTYNGRSAITALLQSLGLNRNDEVWIVTTFDLPNVSSHVTCTIFNICKPSRVLTNKTKAIFVIHEFGVIHPEVKGLRKVATERKIPLIEDCAHTIDSKRDGVSAGRIGDYVIVSFPKIYPVTLGGMLLGARVPYSLSAMELAKLQSISSVILNQTNQWNTHASRRRDIFKQLSAAATNFGLKPLYEINRDITPWFFPVGTSKVEELVELAALQKIDCRPWYGSDIVVLPCHQFLKDEDIRKMIRLMRMVN